MVERGSSDDEARSCSPENGSRSAQTWMEQTSSEADKRNKAVRQLATAWDDFERGCSGYWGAAVIRSVEGGDMRCALTTMRVFSRMRIEHCVSRITEAIAIDKDRPDIVGAILLQLLEDGDDETAVDITAAPVKRGKPAVAFRVFLLLMEEGEVYAVADLFFQLVRWPPQPSIER